MPGEVQPTDQVAQARSSLTLAFSVVGQIGGLTVAVIVVALGAGILLDRTLGTRPLFTLLLMLGSFPVTYFIIYRIALNAVGKIQPAAGAPSPAREERQRDDNA